MAFASKHEVWLQETREYWKLYNDHIVNGTIPDGWKKKKPAVDSGNGAPAAGAVPLTLPADPRAPRASTDLELEEEDRDDIEEEEEELPVLTDPTLQQVVQNAKVSVHVFLQYIVNNVAVNLK